jgi:hypothetical protein
MTIVLHLLLGGIADEVQQSDPRETVLEGLMHSLDQCQKLLPQLDLTISEGVVDSTNALWLQALVSICTIMPYHRPGNSNSSNWKTCLAAARNTMVMLQQALRRNTAALLNIHTVPLVFICSRIVMIEYRLQARGDDAQLTNDLETAFQAILVFKSSLGAMGQKFFNGFIYYLQQDRNQAELDKTGHILDMVRPCDHWPTYEDAAAFAWQEVLQMYHAHPEYIMADG